MDTDDLTEMAWDLIVRAARVSDTLKAELPPYSFNVLRINTGETLTCNKGNTSFKIMLQDI